MNSTEKYTRGVSAVESILTLDRLRQSVAIKELEQTHGQSLSMRKTVSVPNFSQVRHTIPLIPEFFNIFFYPNPNGIFKSPSLCIRELLRQLTKAI